MDIVNILYELIDEAEHGKVSISDDIWPIAFNTIINNEIKTNNESNNITLNIRDINILISKLEEYIKVAKEYTLKVPSYIRNEKDINKLLISYLFVNATTEDFLNPESYIDRYINYIKDNKLNAYDNPISLNIDSIIPDSNIIIKRSKQSVMMETPNKIEISIVSKSNSSLVYKLPEITYGIDNDTCYIYSILNKEKDNNDSDELTKYKKMVGRKLYKLNNNVFDNESDEFKQYKNNESDYYPENITDVSVSSVLSLYIFLNILKDKVSIIKGVPYLPLRYQSRDLSADLSDNKETLKERNDSIQYNITDKFIRTFNRVISHSNFIDIDTYPYEIDEYITCSYKTKDKVIDNEFIYEIDNSIRR